MNKLIIWFLFLFSVSSFSLSISYYSLKIRDNLQVLRKRNKRIKVRKEAPKITFSTIKVKNLLFESLIIKSRLKFELISLLFTLSVLVLLVDFPIQVPRTFGLVLLIIFLALLGRFILYSPNDFLGRFQSYFTKILIILTFTLVLADISLRSPNSIFLLFFSIIIILVFTILFIKSIMDDYSSFLFKILNFIVSYFYLTFFIGLIFGSFYLSQNGIFLFFTEKEYEYFTTSDDITWKDMIFVSAKGITPYFSIPNQTSLSLSSYLTIIPFGEFLLGTIFNVMVIGFFISYFFSFIEQRR